MTASRDQIDGDRSWLRNLTSWLVGNLPDIRGGHCHRHSGKEQQDAGPFGR
jgi:hypothetical protein